MSGIGSISSSNAMTQAMGGMRAMHRPDPTTLAETLFSNLDTTGQGYIQKTDLQTAFDKISSSSTTSSGSSSVSVR